MKKLFLIALLSLSMGAIAQTTSTTATGTAAGNLQGNNQGVSQAILFTSPANATSNVNYSGTQTIKNVPSVNGPNLTTSNDTCMGSSSASVNGPGLGIGFGTTWTDDQCKRLKMSRELWNKGMKAASIAMDCMDPAAKAALEMTGTKCPQSMTADERVTAYGPQQTTGAIAQTAAPPAPIAATPIAATVAPEPTEAIATPVQHSEVSAIPTPTTAPDDRDLVTALAPFEQQ